MLSEVLEELRQGWNRGDPGEVARGQDNNTSRGGNDHIPSPGDLPDPGM